MSGKVGTTGLLKPATVLSTQRSPSTANTRAQSKERHRRTSVSGSFPSNIDGSNSNAAPPVMSYTTNNNTAIHSAASTNSTATTTTTASASSKLTSPSSNSTSGATTATTCSPTIIKTAAPTRPSTGSPLLRSASPHTRAASFSTAPSSSMRNASNSGTGSNHQVRSSSMSSATHLSPWSGPTTYTSNSNNKKTSATADSRLVVLGSPAVGKSALVVRLLTGRFIWEYDPTLEAAYRHHTTVDDDSAVLDILDTAGQSEGGVNEAHARWGDGFILAFSLTDRRSFNAVKDIHDSVASARQSPNFSCVLVANKTDLGHLAEVSEEEASDMAGELGASLFLTSACDGGPAIHAAFSELHRDVIRRRWTRRRRSSAKTVIEGFYKMFSR